MDLEKNLVLSKDDWMSHLKNGVARPDVEEPVLSSLINHLTDLGVFVIAENDCLGVILPDAGETPDRINALLASRLMDLAQTEKGSAVGYFLAGWEQGPCSDGRVDSDPLTKPSTVTIEKEDPRSSPAKRGHDLSNLQIVKKISRQLEPFLEFEKKFLKQLEGPGTTQEDARNLLNYVLERTREKIEPQAWVQLSRRRHK